MNRKVTYARLHQGAYAPNVGELGSVLPPQSKTLENLEMSVSDAGLIVSFKYKFINHEVLIPLANIVLMSLAPEDPKPSKSNKAA